MKSMLFGFLCLAIFGLVFAGPIPEADSESFSPLEARQVPPNEVTIEGVTWNGSGCTAANAKGVLSDDRKILELLFSDYTAQIGGTAKPGDAFRNCYIIIKLRVPPGWSVTLYDFEYEGYYSVDAGVSARQMVSYYFNPPGRTRSLSRSFTINGQSEGQWIINDVFQKSEWVFCPCGKNTLLNIDTSLVVSRRGSGTGFITTNKLTGNVIHRYGLYWQRC